MNIHKLEKIFDPHRIALIGVTINPNSVGGKVLTNLIAGGFRGVVYPINAESEAVMGVPCYPDLKSLPKVPDLAVICTAAEKVPQTVLECGEAGIRGIVILSAGFKEIGEAGKKLENQIREYRKRFDGMRIIGPNCLGIIIPGKNLNLSFAGGMPKAGNVRCVHRCSTLRSRGKSASRILSRLATRSTSISAT
jgi:acetyltransferase